MVGFALSGVVLALLRDAFAAPGEAAAGGPAGAAGGRGGGRLPVHHDQPVQSAAIAEPGDLAAAALEHRRLLRRLLPFFFLAGLFISLSFVLNADRIGRVYGFDLTGAGAGAAASLAAMFVVHAFYLVPLLLVPLAASACSSAGPLARASAGGRVLALVGGRGAAAAGRPGRLQRFQGDLRAAAHAGRRRSWPRSARRAATMPLLDDFTERVDTDISNNAGMLGVARPAAQLRAVSRRQPHRRAAEARARCDVGYAAAALDALPYALIPHPRVLLAGASGGFRIAEVLHARRLDDAACWSPSRCCCARCSDGLGPVASRRSPTRASAAGRSAGPLAASGRRSYDIVDLSADFLDAAEANASAFTAEAIAAYLQRARAGRHRVDPGLDPRFPGLCAAHAGDRARRAAGRRHRRSAGACRSSIAPPGTSAS